MAREPFPLGFRLPTRAERKAPPSRPDHRTRPLEELDSRNLLRALCGLRFDRKMESLSDLMGAHGAYLAVLTDRREYFPANHNLTISAIDASLSPDQGLKQEGRTLRVDHHTQRDLLGGKSPASLPERTEWDASAACQVPWRSDRFTVLVGVGHRSTTTFDPADLACLREWASDLRRHLNRAHRQQNPAPSSRYGRSRRERKLKLLHEIVDRSRDALFMFDPETGDCLAASRQASEEVGLPREDLLGCTVMDLWETMDSRGDWRNLVWRVRRNERGVYHEDRLRTAEGSDLPVEASLRYVLRPEGDCVLAVSRSHRRRDPPRPIVDREGISPETLLRNLPDPLFVKDAEWLRYVRINPAFEEQFGYREEDVLGQTDYDLFPDHQARRFRAEDRRVLREEVSLEIERQAVWTADRGRRWYRTVKFPVPDDPGSPTYLLGIAREIRDSPDPSRRGS